MTKNNYRTTPSLQGPRRRTRKDDIIKSEVSNLSVPPLRRVRTHMDKLICRPLYQCRIRCQQGLRWTDSLLG